MDNHYTLDGITDDLKETVERIGTDLEPQDDWMPTMICYGDMPAIVGIPELGDKNAKGIICNVVIPELLKKTKPEFVALITMGWMKEYDPKTLEGAAEMARDEATYDRGNIADRPGRSEVLTIQIVGKDGSERQLFAYVHRYPTSAPLLQWREHNCTHSEGLFPETLRSAMEAAWKPQS